MTINSLVAQIKEWEEGNQGISPCITYVSYDESSCSLRFRVHRSSTTNTSNSALILQILVNSEDTMPYWVQTSGEEDADAAAVLVAVCQTLLERQDKTVLDIVKHIHETLCPDEQRRPAARRYVTPAPGFGSGSAHGVAVDGHGGDGYEGTVAQLNLTDDTPPAPPMPPPTAPRPRFEGGRLGGGFPVHADNPFSSPSLYRPDEKRNISKGRGEVTKMRLALRDHMKKLNDTGIFQWRQVFASKPMLWQLRLQNLPKHQKLAQQLQAYAARNNCAAEVVIEVLFPDDFPTSSPCFRVISPRFTEFTDATDVAGDGTAVAATGSSDGAGGGGETGTITAPSDTMTRTASAAMEGIDDWNFSLGFIGIAGRILRLLNSSDATIDESATADWGVPTADGLWVNLVAYSPSVIFSKDSDRAQRMNNSGRVALPRSLAQKLISQGDSSSSASCYGGYGHGDGSPDGSPSFQTVQLEFGSKTQRVFGTFESFDMEDGIVCIPQWMMSSLRIEDGAVISVRRVRCPMGQTVTFRPHSTEFMEKPEAVAVLTDRLPTYAVLSTGSTFELSHDGRMWKFDVVATTPARAICITGDVDLKTMFDAPLDAAEVEAKRRQDKLEEAKAARVSEIAPIPDGSSAAEQAIANQHQRVTCSDCNLKMERSALAAHLSQCPFKGLGRTLSDGLSRTMSKEGHTRCPNCRKVIADATFEMHSIRCVRDVTPCAICDIPVVNSSMESHMASAHGNVQCPLCNTEMPKHVLERHADECDMKPVDCIYCGIRVAAKDMDEHQRKASCGSKTDKCMLCSSSACKKDMISVGEHLWVHPFCHGGDAVFGGGGGGGDDGAYDVSYRPQETLSRSASGDSVSSEPSGIVRSMSLFICETCGRSSRGWDNYNKHLKDTHGQSYGD